MKDFFKNIKNNLFLIFGVGFFVYYLIDRNENNKKIDNLLKMNDSLNKEVILNTNKLMILESKYIYLDSLSISNEKVIKSKKNNINSNIFNKNEKINSINTYNDSIYRYLSNYKYEPYRKSIN